MFENKKIKSFDIQQLVFLFAEHWLHVAH